MQNGSCSGSEELRDELRRVLIEKHNLRTIEAELWDGIMQRLGGKKIYIPQYGTEAQRKYYEERNQIMKRLRGSGISLKVIAESFCVTIQDVSKILKSMRENEIDSTN